MPHILPMILLSSHVVLAAAQDVPRLDVAHSCRDAQRYGAQDRTTFGKCMNDEDGARQQLVKEWPTFKNPDRATCLEETNSDGLPSYVELLECLETARDAGKYDKKDNPEPSTKQ